MRKRRTPAVIRAEVERTLRDAGGDVERAAALAGCTVPTYHQRARRCGIRLSAARALVEAGVSLTPPPAGDAVVSDAGVTMTLADYAMLREAAAMGAEARRLAAALEVADRTVAVLTRHLEELGRRRAA